jgi:NTE family protein
MASGALPPGFPPIEIDGELYWDGGLVSNTPLQYVLDQETREDLLVFQVDLFNARGAPPRNLLEAAKREKDIRYSSRTRMNTDSMLDLHRAKALIRELIAEAAPERLADPRVRELAGFSQDNAVTVAHLIFRPKHYDSHSRDYEFSRVAMLEHWGCGLHDVEQTLHDPAWLNRKRPEYGVAVFDLGRGSPHIATETPKRFAPEEERAPKGRSRAAE